MKTFWTIQFPTQKDQKPSCLVSHAHGCSNHFRESLCRPRKIRLGVNCVICANECCLRDPLVRFESTRISPWKSCWRAQSGKMNECCRLECWIVRAYVALCSQMLTLQYTFACTECGGIRKGCRMPPVTGRGLCSYLFCADCDTITLHNFLPDPEEPEEEPEEGKKPQVAKEPEEGKKRPMRGYHRLMQNRKRLGYGLCASDGCPRSTQYFEGCAWDRCCKLGCVTDCLEHEQWCDEQWFEMLEDIDDESDFLGSNEDGQTASSSTTMLRDSQYR